jgi:hypothetical protein
MQKALQSIFSWFIKANPLQKRNGRKTRGQSLVEVAIAFPILIMLFAGVVEFGFILNYYLSLLDATREAARVYSGGDPFDTTLFDVTHGEDTFYYNAADLVRKLLDPSLTFANPASYQGRRISLDPATDDVIVTVYGAQYTSSGVIVTLWRDAGAFHLFDNHESMFTADSIKNSRVCGAPTAGILLVEVYYNYHQILGLPWMTAFLPNPLPLRAYTIMPIRAGEPLPINPTPVPPVCPP